MPVLPAVIGQEYLADVLQEYGVPAARVSILVGSLGAAYWAHHARNGLVLAARGVSYVIWTLAALGVLVGVGVLLPGQLTPILDFLHWLAGLI